MKLKNSYNSYFNKIKVEYNKKIKELKDISFAYQELKQKSSNIIEMLKNIEKNYWTKWR